MLIYECNETECYVGSRVEPSTYKNTGISDQNYAGILTIPRYYDNKPIKYIGHCSFYGCSYITEVHIKARITIMYKYAFGHMPNLRYINVPSTCTFLGSQSIYSYNNSNKNSPNAAGTLVIKFERNSQLQEIAINAFGRKDKIILVSCDKMNKLSKVDSAFYSASTINYIEVLSLYSFSIGNLKSSIMNELKCSASSCNVMINKRSCCIHQIVIMILLIHS